MLRILRADWDANECWAMSTLEQRILSATRDDHARNAKKQFTALSACSYYKSYNDEIERAEQKTLHGGQRS